MPLHEQPRWMPFFSQKRRKTSQLIRRVAALQILCPECMQKRHKMSFPTCLKHKITCDESRLTRKWIFFFDWYDYELLTREHITNGLSSIIVYIYIFFLPLQSCASSTHRPVWDRDRFNFWVLSYAKKNHRTKVDCSFPVRYKTVDLSFDQHSSCYFFCL